MKKYITNRENWTNQLELGDRVAEALYVENMAHPIVRNSYILNRARKATKV